MKNSKINIEAIPKGLKEYDQWVAWKLEKAENGGKPPKIPINPQNGNYASPTDPEKWGSFNEALKRYETNYLAGIGFVFTEDDTYTGIDLDNCRDKKTGKIEKCAQKIIDYFNSYTEVSPSGTGVKIIIEGKLPDGGRKKGNIEMYDNGRFFTITGNLLEDHSKKIKKRPQKLKKFHAKTFGKASNDVKIYHTSPCLLTDEEIISKAKEASNGHKFKKLFKGHAEDYSSSSEADLALCSILAFWSGNDSITIDRLFRTSGLMRDKWNKIHDPNGKRTYGQMTIDKAIASCRDVFQLEPTQDIKKEVEALLESSRVNPKSAIKDILKDKNAINNLALLYKRERNEFEAFLQELKGIRVSVRDIESLGAVIKSAVKKDQITTNPISNLKAEAVKIKRVLPNAPVSDTLIVPQGWRINDKGVFQEKNNTSYGIQLEKIAPFPVLIQGHLKNITDGTEDIRIIWFDGKKWISHTANRVEIADAKLIVKISDYGCPVTSATATSMVKYLAAFEAANNNILPQGIATYQLGWQGERGRGGFLWGQNLLTSDGDLLLNMNIERMSPDEWPEALIFFKGRDAGEDQIAKGFHKKGKFKKWLKTISIINQYPLVTFSIYSALAPPLLMILDEANFVVDWASPTSRGKTTTLKFAASCWGNPDQRSSTSVLRSWDLTRVYSERTLIAQRDLPLVLDDTKRASKPELVSKIIYDISSGQGRGRGSIQGIRDTGSWRTIALSNGESKATSFTTADGGTHARVLSIWGSPFGKKDKKKAKMISEITRTLYKNYGHAGYRFIQYLMENRKKWKSWKERYYKLVDYYQNKAGSNEVALRQSSFFAVIHLTAILTKRALNLPINYKRHFPKIFIKVIAETCGADRAKEALQEVLSWAVSNKDSFWKPGGKSDKQPLNGWLGVWNPNVVNISINKKKSGRKTDSDTWQEDDENNNLESIAIMPNQLHKFLKGEGYEAKAILRTWKDKGWLDTSGEQKGHLKKVSIDGERPRCYVITEEAIKKGQD